MLPLQLYCPCVRRMRIFFPCLLYGPIPSPGESTYPFLKFLNYNGPKHLYRERTSLSASSLGSVLFSGYPPARYVIAPAVPYSIPLLEAVSYTHLPGIIQKYLYMPKPLPRQKTAAHSCWWR